MPHSLRLCVSVVLHRSDPAVLARTLDCLWRACERAGPSLGRVELVLVDNASGPAYRSMLEDRILRRWPGAWRLLALTANRGYGAGHNAVHTNADLRLILNPDVFLAPGALRAALAWLQAHPETGVVVPWGEDENGAPAWLCKAYPGWLTLAIRTLPPRWRPAAEMACYEQRHRNWGEAVVDPGLVSGCCFLIRETVWHTLGGFDPGYFLYFEDFDLALRARRLTSVVCLPDFRIVHLGGGVAAKGWRHRYWFLRSAVRFFNRHGWRWRCQPWLYR